MATHRVPSPYQITDLSKEVFTLKEALKVQQTTPASSKEEEEALRNQVTALQQQIQVLALECGAGVMGATDSWQGAGWAGDISHFPEPATSSHQTWGFDSGADSVGVSPCRWASLPIPFQIPFFLPSPSCSLPPSPPLFCSRVSCSPG